MIAKGHKFYMGLWGSAQDAPLCHLRKKKKKNSRGRKKKKKKKKTQIYGPEGAPNFSNQQMTKSDFHDVVLAF